jgi:hypothetical protein
MQFAFHLNLPNGGTHTDMYSKENQVLIAASFNIGHSQMSLYHEITEGLNAGLILQHLLNFETRTITIVGERTRGYAKLRIVVLTPKL